MLRLLRDRVAAAAAAGARAVRGLPGRDRCGSSTSDGGLYRRGRRRAARRVRRSGDQPRAVRSRLGLARRRRARGGRRVVHRRRRGAADEAVHDLHERRARAGARARASAGGSPRSSKRVANHQEWGVRVVLDRLERNAAAAAPKQARGSDRTGVAYLARKKAQRDASVELAARARETVAGALRSARRALAPGAAAVGERAAGAGRSAAARRGVSRAADAVGVVSGARGARSARARASRLRPHASPARGRRTRSCRIDDAMPKRRAPATVVAITCSTRRTRPCSTCSTIFSTRASW